MKEYFEYILKNYINDDITVDSSTELYNVIKRKLPNYIESQLCRTDLLVNGSMGQGNKTDYPWVAVMNKNVTTSTQKGFYIVYLFKKDMSGFYLTLNQGFTFFKNEYRSKSYENAVKVADYFRSQIEDTSFSKLGISLAKEHATKDFGYGYEKTTILSKYYTIEHLDSKILIRDLKELLFIYDDICNHIVSNYDQAVKDVLIEVEDVLQPAEDAVDIIRKLIDPNNDMPYGFVRNLVEVSPYQDLSKRYRKMTNPKVSKIDYIHRAQRDAENGLLGEELVINFERNRLIDLGLEEYSDMIKWVSRESDAYGYDILSYDFDENKNVKEIKIEVKTTQSRVDTEFFVSKNELETSKQYKQNYCVYRIYDVRSQMPRLYRVAGCITDNFILDPVTYMARYKQN